jgi:hypothetical protein
MFDVSNPPAVVRSIEEGVSEAELVQAAADCVSRSKWFVGQCAVDWQNRFGAGRTDADFGELVGLSGESVYQRRRVFETFADVRELYPNLEKKWSHFLSALTWDDAEECLSWANENQASRREMVAFRKMQHGESLTETTDESAPWESTEENSEGITEGNSEGIMEDDIGTDSAVTDDGGDDEHEGSSPENESPVETEVGKPYAPFRGEESSPERSAGVSDVDGERITKAAQDNRPARIDAAAVAFRKSCESLRSNLRQFVGAATDKEQRTELEGILVAALEEVRSE